MRQAKGEGMGGEEEGERYEGGGAGRRLKNICTEDLMVQAAELELHSEDRVFRHIILTCLLFDREYETDQHDVRLTYHQSTSVYQ